MYFKGISQKSNCMVASSDGTALPFNIAKSKYAWPVPGSCKVKLSGRLSTWLLKPLNFFCAGNTSLREFRAVKLGLLGDRIETSCDISSPAHWIDVNNNIVTNNSGLKIVESANKVTMVITNLTLENAGVYFCLGPNRTGKYGAVVIYARGK